MWISFSRQKVGLEGFRQKSQGICLFGQLGAVGIGRKSRKEAARMLVGQEMAVSGMQDRYMAEFYGLFHSA